VQATGQQTDNAALFTALVDRHSRFLYRVAFSLLNNRQDAEDAVQETFMKLYRTGAWQHSIDDERAYLSRAVWRSGLDRVATAQAKAMRHAEDITNLELPSLATSPEQDAVDQSDRTLLRILIDALPPDLRQPLLLSAVEDMRSSDVAITLGIPEATVRTRIHRAKAELRRRFEALTIRKVKAEVLS
jgi:RNA polymerase sigma-70 factor (ECF subfamily)